jgi:hypothetical protein
MHVPPQIKALFDPYSKQSLTQEVGAAASILLRQNHGWWRDANRTWLWYAPFGPHLLAMVMARICGKRSALLTTNGRIWR